MARGIVTNEEEGDIAMGCGAAGSGLRTSLFTTWTPLAAVTSCVPACLSACLASSRFLSSSSSSVSFSVLSHLACLPSPWQQQQEISEELVRAGCWLQRPALGVGGRKEGRGERVVGCRQPRQPTENWPSPEPVLQGEVVEKKKATHTAKAEEDWLAEETSD